ncbi:MAG TPA: hypothetical protein VFV32_03085 [Acidimicrobiales bacterium]|nr:hypothetical protein [Acidimicrobiales bacterium]
MKASERLLVGVGLALTAVTSSPASGQETAGPVVTVGTADVWSGDRVLVTLEGFRGSVVTLSICGNEARRGSADCNMAASQGVGLERSGAPTMTEYRAVAPAVPCPCVLRASTASQDEVAAVPINLLDHPVGPVTGPETLPPVEVRVGAAKDPGGLLERLRSTLGGATTYAVTVSVRNPTTIELANLVLTGSAGRPDRDTVDLDLGPVGVLAPGQTWTDTIRVDLPSPVVGEYRFDVTASGAGASVRASSRDRSVPMGLVVLSVVFVADVGAIAWRRLADRRRSSAAGSDRARGRIRSLVTDGP